MPGPPPQKAFRNTNGLQTLHSTGVSPHAHYEEAQQVEAIKAPDWPDSSSGACDWPRLPGSHY